MGDGLNSAQIALIRTLWEVAQDTIDARYVPGSAEAEKQAMEKWMQRVFPNECDNWIRSNSKVVT